jgi:hypothetical protein
MIASRCSDCRSHQRSHLSKITKFFLPCPDRHLTHQRDWDQKHAKEAAAAKQRPHQRASSSNSRDDVNMVDSGTNLDNDEQYWRFFDQTVPIVEEDEDEPEDIIDQVERRHVSKITIVSRSPRRAQAQITHDYMY